MIIITETEVLEIQDKQVQPGSVIQNTMTAAEYAEWEQSLPALVRKQAE